jgi:FKBP-type peptidyl-prolyl cis-trans isomerase 2
MMMNISCTSTKITAVQRRHSRGTHRHGMPQHHTPSSFLRNGRFQYSNIFNKSILSIGICASSSETPAERETMSQSASLTAQEGDIVTIHWSCLNDQGEVIDSSKTAGEPTTFEVGAGDIVGNQLFEAFDEAVRGLSPGETIGIKADGGPWQEELLFKVPREHPEIQRMEGRYKNQGGVQEGLIAELSNGGLALVVECTDDVVTLDANSMMAGKTLLFELELLHVERTSTSSE